MQPNQTDVRDAWDGVRRLQGEVVATSQGHAANCVRIAATKLAEHVVLLFTHDAAPTVPGGAGGWLGAGGLGAGARGWGSGVNPLPGWNVCEGMGGKGDGVGWLRGLAAACGGRCVRLPLRCSAGSAAPSLPCKNHTTPCHPGVPETLVNKLRLPDAARLAGEAEGLLRWLLEPLRPAAALDQPPVRLIAHVSAAWSVAIARPNLMGKLLPVLMALAKEVSRGSACATSVCSKWGRNHVCVYAELGLTARTLTCSPTCSPIYYSPPAPPSAFLPTSRAASSPAARPARRGAAAAT